MCVNLCQLLTSSSPCFFRAASSPRSLLALDLDDDDDDDDGDEENDDGEGQLSVACARWDGWRAASATHSETGA